MPVRVGALCIPGALLFVVVVVGSWMLLTRRVTVKLVGFHVEDSGRGLGMLATTSWLGWFRREWAVA